MRWLELVPGDVAVEHETQRPAYVVLAVHNSVIKLLSLDDGKIFDYPRSSGHMMIYGFACLRGDEVLF